MNNKMSNGSGKKEKNPMEQVRFEKLVLHCTTSDKSLLERYAKLLKLISNRKVVFIKAKRRIQAFKIRPGLDIGCKVTIRGSDGIELAKRLFVSVGNKIQENRIQDGFASFGIKEYIDIPGVDYQRELGILGFDVDIVLSKCGKRVKTRKIKRSKVGDRQKVNKQETINFLKNNFNVTVE